MVPLPGTCPRCGSDVQTSEVTRTPESIERFITHTMQPLRRAGWKQVQKRLERAEKGDLLGVSMAEPGRGFCWARARAYLVGPSRGSQGRGHLVSGISRPDVSQKGDSDGTWKPSAVGH